MNCSHQELQPSLVSHQDGNSSYLNTVDISDIGMSEERFQLSVLNKASAISHLVSGITIGCNAPLRKINNQSTLSINNAAPQPLKISPRMLETTDHKKIFRNDTAGVIEKLIYEQDQKRKSEVQEVMRIRLDMLQQKAREQEKEVSQKQANLKDKLEDRADIERQQAQRLQQELEFQESQRQVNLVLAEQKRAQERMQLIKLANEQAEESRKQKEAKKIQMDKIKDSEHAFYVNYQQLLDCISSCIDKEALQASCSSNLTMVKSLKEGLIQLVHQCSVGEVSSLDLQTANAINNQLQNCYKIIQESSRKINEQYEETRAKEKALRQQEEDKKAAAVIPTTVTAINPVPERLGSVDDENLQVYSRHKDFIEVFQESMTSLKQDRVFKEFSFNCKKAVNIPVNAISDVSGAHLHDKLKKLTFLLLGETVDLGDTRFSAKAHPQGISFCMDLLAQKLVSQGKTSVSSKGEAAFPLAAITVALWAEFPVFGELFLAHLHIACPYLVPVYLPQVTGQSDEDYYKLLGYSYDDSNSVEKQDKFLKKVSGIMRLYAAIMITPVRHQLRRPHPHGMSQAWHWISCIVNLEPARDITATLLLSFLEVAGSAMGATYGIQFQKLIHIICTSYFSKIQNIDGHGGPIARLEVFLQGVLKKGIARPHGMLAPNFW